jgi:ftsW/rodA/spoVE family cell division protein
MEALYFSIPVGLVMIQPNLSTTIIMTVIVAAMTFASPLKLKWIFAFLGAVLFALASLFYLFTSGLYVNIPFIQPYQLQRILTFLNPAENSDDFYQQMWSIMAIGSGMFNGKGLFNNSIFSVKNGNFLVEEDNDFIFAVIGEELGFRGSLIIIIIFLLIILECLIIAYRAKTLSGRLICVGVMAWIGFQTYTNIAVATGLFPNTGITLPFFSRGVSSLLSVYFGFGIVLNVALQRKT